jgi:hypothetical protein
MAGPVIAVVLLFWVGVSWLSVILIGALLVLYELGIRWLAPDVPAAAEPPAA